MRRQSPASRGESLHTAEHVFDFVPLTIEDAAVTDRRFSILSARDAGRDAGVIHPRNSMREHKTARYGASAQPTTKQIIHGNASRHHH